MPCDALSFMINHSIYIYWISLNTLPYESILNSNKILISNQVKLKSSHYARIYFTSKVLVLIHGHSLYSLTTRLCTFSAIPPSTPNTGTGSSSSSKKNSSRRNAWGNYSYADLITQAISSAQDNRLTLSQIYEWMVQNIPYFKDKGDSNSSAGWKVSLTHYITFFFCSNIYSLFIR